MDTSGGSPIPDEHLRRTESALREMHRITTSTEAGFPDQFRRILELGCRQFGLPFGALSQLKGESLEVIHVATPSDGIAEGSLLSLGETFCAETLRSGEPLGFHHAGASRWKSHPAYRKTSFESYLGSPIRVDGQTWGTLCFFSFDQRNLPVLRRGIRVIDLSGFQMHRQVAEAGVVIQKIIFDRLSLVAQSQHKITKAMALIDFHDVPEHGAPTDFNHGLGLEMGFFGKPGSQTATKNNYFHFSSLNFQVSAQR